MTERSSQRGDLAVGTATVAIGLTSLGLAGVFTYAAAANAAATANPTPAATIGLTTPPSPRGESDSEEYRSPPAGSVQAAPQGSQPVAVSGGS